MATWRAGLSRGELPWRNVLEHGISAAQDAPRRAALQVPVGPIEN